LRVARCDVLNFYGVARQGWRAAEFEVFRKLSGIISELGKNSQCSGLEMRVATIAAHSLKKRRTTAAKEGTPTDGGSVKSLVATISDTSASDVVATFDPRVLLTKLTAGKTTRNYASDEPIFSQGDPADAVFYVQSGRVKLTVVSKSGKEAVVAILLKDSFFGEGCLAGQPLRMSTASAEQPGTIIRVEKSVMLALLQKDPEFAARFLTYLLARNIRMEADLVDHLFNSSEKRLARLLLLLANFGQESKPIPLLAKVSQETLAEMIGTTRSRVSFFLNRFRDLGFIDYDGGGMQINSSLVNVVLLD
jgi:CRP/FNR family cyclic AMP-dependent transcriptional regulator